MEKVINTMISMTSVCPDMVLSHAYDVDHNLNKLSYIVELSQSYKDMDEIHDTIQSFVDIAKIAIIDGVFDECDFKFVRTKLCISYNLILNTGRTKVMVAKHDRNGTRVTGFTI